MKTIEQYKEDMKEQKPEIIRRILDTTLDNIKTLESMYQTGGALNHFSEKFRDAAYLERQEHCQLSSACYSLLRNIKQEGR